MAKTEKLNLVVFGVDSLRADHMSCYGYSRPTTRIFADRLAEEGTLVEQAFSAYIPTTPAYSSMLTGMDVMSTGMVSLQPLGPLPEEYPTLPEVLKRHGYRTACIGFGSFYRGFDRYANFEAWGPWEDRPLRKAENLNAATFPILDDMVREGKPFFLFLRHMDPHSPYLPPPPFDTMFYTKDPCDPSKNTMKPVFDFKPFAEFFRSWMPPGVTDADWAIAAYDGELAYMDACQQVIFQRLEDLGVLDNTLIVYTSDHGETLYDHEIWFDHHGLYDQTLHIPLIFWRPGLIPQSKRVTGYSLQEDLMPTVLDLLGLESHRKRLTLDGQSLVPVIFGEKKAVRSEFYITECTWMRKRGWRTPHWKYFEALEPDFHNKPKYELYDLINDPGELHNLAEEQPEVCAALRKRMKAWVSKRLKETGKPDPILQHRIGLDRKIGSIATAKQLQQR
jgi:arylsulfatase A-like enzyme